LHVHRDLVVSNLFDTDDLAGISAEELPAGVLEVQFARTASY
jgi:hypothetical protein